jgi:diguanylate cyclase (GGDEF)-like protein
MTVEYSLILPIAALFAFIFLELRVMYGDSMQNVGFVTSAYLLNITVFCNICIIIATLAAGNSASMIEIVSENYKLLSVIILSCYDIAIFALVYLVPLTKIKNMLYDKKQRMYMNIWMFLSWCYLIFDYTAWEHLEMNHVVAANIIIKDLMLLAGGYLLLFTNVIISKYMPYFKQSQELKKDNFKLRHDVEFDGLSGLYNKKATEKKINEYLKIATEGQKHAVLMIIDIDNFKYVNDNLGHISGDRLIAEFSEDIRQFMCHQGMAGRIGGDEFILLFEKQNVEQILKEHQMERLLSICNRYVENEEGKFINATGSIGLTEFPKDGTSYLELYKKADKALYKSKHAGKNRYSVYGD